MIRLKARLRRMTAEEEPFENCFEYYEAMTGHALKL
jgi:hypothetical protein